jgi:hypothetical protein
MIQFDLALLCINAEVIGRNIANLNQLIETGKGNERLPQYGELGVFTLSHGVRNVVEKLDALGAPHTLALAKDLIRRFESASGQWNAVAAAEALQMFHKAFLRECRMHIWLRMDGRYIPFIEPSPWGADVERAFPEAAIDIRSAGIALGVDLPTAAVFHAMRVTEYGLRWLARRLRVRLTDKGRRQPLEYADWQKVITECQNQLKATRQLPKAQKRQERLAKYSRAADHCDYMKDIWRNDVSHTRRVYSAPEAEAVVQRVREFMQFLAPAV